MSELGLIAWASGAVLVLGYQLVPGWYTVEGMSAIATASGTLSALWFSLEGRRKARHDSWERATLAAAGLVASMHSATQLLFATYNDLTFEIPGIRGPFVSSPWR